jgi:hypothetical protein
MSCSSRGVAGTSLRSATTTEHWLAPQQCKLTGKQAATAVQLHMVLRCGPTHEAELILMVDFASTQAQAKEVAPLLAVRGPG